MAPSSVRRPPCQEVVWTGAEVDLTRLPIQHCWPGDVAPLITWGLTITRGPHKKRQNLGIYRQQVIGHNQLIMRWLAHRGGALDFAEHAKQHPGQPYPVAVAMGPIRRPSWARSRPCPIRCPSTSLPACCAVPAPKWPMPCRCRCKCRPAPKSCWRATSTLTASHKSGYQHALEGPYGDHTGYYNECAEFPVFTVERITQRQDAIYHSTYTGKPPDEPAMLGLALNELFVPLLQRAFPEIIDFYLPPEACSYRMAVVSIKKAYAGHARRVMMGVWSHLRQFLYTKFVVVVDEDIDVRSWPEVIWAMTTRMDPCATPCCWKTHRLITWTLPRP